MPETVYIVHSIDTEGPLYEPITATFERLKSIFNIELEATEENLLAIQKKQINLGGKEQDVAEVFSPHNITYYDSWQKIDAMLEEVTSAHFRNLLPDSFGDGWIFNWHCLDLVGFKDNPRRRELGYGKVFEHYKNLVDRSNPKSKDALHFHYHPVPFSKAANVCATHFFSNSNSLFEILSRRIIDHNWFPAAFRAGFHCERPDSHWFLEQYVPFDFSSQAVDDSKLANQRDLAAGRYGDWRQAPRNWQPYHPDHDDYQKPGNCRRWITRCLNMPGSRLRMLEQPHVDQAFEEAGSGKPTILAFTNHDFRDMRSEIDATREMIRSAASRFPKVKFKYCEAKEAMRLALQLKPTPPCKLRFEFEGNRLFIRSDMKPFGPQPFLALKTKAGEYHHDNLDFQESGHLWSYTLDGQTFHLNQIERIGVGTCDAYGNSTTLVMDLATRETKLTHN
ncbi:hypothetical protein K2X30_10825 [bacterium]|nr:hypothetical protein [bacterium]